MVILKYIAGNLQIKDCRTNNKKRKQNTTVVKRIMFSLSPQISIFESPKPHDYATLHGKKGLCRND